MNVLEKTAKYLKSNSFLGKYKKMRGKMEENPSDEDDEFIEELDLDA